MKFINLLMTVVLLTGIVLSFSLKASNTIPLQGTFEFNANGTILCMYGQTAEPECNMGWNGPACTINYMGAAHKAYAGRGQYACMHPLFQPF